MTSRRRTSFFRQGQEYSRNDFYKAIYAVRCDRQTKGIACAVNIDGQNNDKTTNSALLITWREIGQSRDFFMDRFSRKHFGKYHLQAQRSDIRSSGYFSLIRGSRSNRKDRWDLVCLEIKYLKLEEQMADFRVFTINGNRFLPLQLRYNKKTSNHDLIIDEHLFDLKLCGAPIIAEQKYFVGVLRKDPDHPNKFIPCFIFKGVFGE